MWRVGSRDAERIHHLPRPPSPLHRSSAARGGREQGEGEQVSSAALAEYKYTPAHACIRSHGQVPKNEGSRHLGMKSPGWESSAYRGAVCRDTSNPPPRGRRLSCVLLRENHSP